MSDLETKLETAGNEISEVIAATLLALAPRLAKKYDITEAQLTVAIVRSHVMLMAAGVAGIVCGPQASDEKLNDTIMGIVRRTQPIIGAALDSLDEGAKPDV